MRANPQSDPEYHASVCADAKIPSIAAKIAYLYKEISEHQQPWLYSTMSCEIYYILS